MSADRPEIAILRNGQSSLAELAQKINAKCEAGISKVRLGLEDFRDIGFWLIEAREKTPPHTWLAWVRDNIQFDIREVQRFIQLAENWDLIRAKCDTMSHLGLTEALKLIPKKPPPDEPEKFNFLVEMNVVEGWLRKRRRGWPEDKRILFLSGVQNVLRLMEEDTDDGEDD